MAEMNELTGQEANNLEILSIFDDIYWGESQSTYEKAKKFIYIYVILLSLLSLVMIILLIKRRNLQPLKKKSPMLIIVSVIGNILC
mmetsp:Transcript_13206/g.22405  ORF Transcript_13206/g.22405 Transcript_13206/m.22405 type:complete len:86 (+) Transcript_13206:34-291(+)